MRASNARASLVLWALALAATANLSAHRRDELLQATRIDIGADRIDVDVALTPGIAVADAVIADLDVNHDGTVTAAEQERYVARILAGLGVSVDDRSLPLQAINTTFVPVEALRRGEGVIQLQLVAQVPPYAVGAHRLVFRNSYRRDISAYLANVLAPATKRISVTALRRDPEQRELAVDYRFAGVSVFADFLRWLSRTSPM